MKKLFSGEEDRVRPTPEPKGKRKSGRDGRATAVQFTLHYAKGERMRVRRAERLRLAFRDEWCWKEEEEEEEKEEVPLSCSLSLSLTLSLPLCAGLQLQETSAGAQSYAQLRTDGRIKE